MWKFVSMLVGICLFVGCTGGEWDRPNDEPVHEETWMDTQRIGTNDFHGAVAKAQGTRVCANCHGEDLRGQPQAPGCYDCHGAGSDHVLGQPWLDKKSDDFHGSVAKDNCTNCHNLSQKCNTCHFGETGSKSPPRSGWVHDGNGQNEDHRDLESHMTTCNQCHGLNRSFGNGPATCHDCHEEEDDDFD